MLILSIATRIDINASPLEELVKIVHIGKARALELISLRPFSSLDDLTRINGIGESRVNDIKKQGLARIGEAQSAETQLAQNQPAAAADFLPADNSQFPFLLSSGLVIAISLGFAILFLKKKLLCQDIATPKP